MKYHFLYKDNEEDHTSKGLVIDANSPEHALKQFTELHPTVVFLAMTSSELVDRMFRS